MQRCGHPRRGERNARRVPPDPADPRSHPHVERDVGRQRRGHQVRRLRQQARRQHVPGVRRRADVEDVRVGAGHRCPRERLRRRHVSGVGGGVGHRGGEGRRGERNARRVPPDPADPRPHPHVERDTGRQRCGHQVRGLINSPAATTFHVSGAVPMWRIYASAPVTGVHVNGCAGDTLVALAVG